MVLAHNDPKFGNVLRGVPFLRLKRQVSRVLTVKKGHKEGLSRMVRLVDPVKPVRNRGVGRKGGKPLALRHYLLETLI